MKAIEIIATWKDMTDIQQENYCKAAVAAALNNRYHLSTGYTFEDAVQDTFLRVLEAMQAPEALDADSDRRTTAGKTGNTLSMVINRAARAGLERMAYHVQIQKALHSKQSFQETKNKHCRFWYRDNACFFYICFLYSVTLFPVHVANALRKEFNS